MIENTLSSAKRLLQGIDSSDNRIRRLAAHLVFAATIATCMLVVLLLTDFSGWTDAPRTAAALLLFVGLAWSYGAATRLEKHSHVTWASALIVVLEWVLLACAFPALVWVQRKLVPAWLLETAFAPGGDLAGAIDIAMILVVLVGLPLITARYMRRSFSARVAQAQARLYEQMAHEDALTRLPNRRGLERYAQRATPTTEGLGVLMVDVDNFKSINDTHGHEVGDLALEAVAAALRGATAGRGLAARLAGDEFVVALRGATREEFLDLEMRVREAGRAIVVRPPGHAPFDISLSVGPAWSDRAETLSEVLRRGDAAMYEDKRAARGRRGGSRAA